METWFTMKQDGKTIELDIFDEIGIFGITAKDVKAELDKFKDYDEIIVNLNSPGGACFEGFAIYNMLKNNKAHVTVIVNGLAASIASIIAMSADTLIMYDNSYIMIHLPYTLAVGTEKDMEKACEVLARIKNDCVKTYKTRFDNTDDEIITMMENETWISGAEAKEKGIIDEFRDGLEVAAKFDFQNFKNAPENAKALFQKPETDQTENKGDDQPGEKPGDPQALYIQACDTIIDLKAQLSTKDTELTQAKSQIATLQSEKDKAENQLVDVNARLAKLVSPGMQKPDDSVNTWHQALEECGNDYVKARQSYPEIWKNYVDQNQK